MDSIVNRFTRVTREGEDSRESGQALVEYALILVLIAIVVIGILSLLGRQVSTVFSQVNSGLSS